MSSVATTNITNITRTVAGSKGTGLQIGNQPMACFRIAAGQAPGDTAVLNDPNVPNILTVMGPVTNNIGTSATGVSSVTVTIGALTGTAITATVGAIDVWIMGPLPTS